MNKTPSVEFKSLITIEEYNRLYDKFKNEAVCDTQTNHYFDTSRFTLRALDTSLKVREKDNNDFSLTYKRKKGYNIDVISDDITSEIFENIKSTGFVEIPKIQEELTKLIKDQKLINFLSLSTHRISIPMYSGVLNIDKSTYLDTTDYEIEYSTTSYHQGKDEFIKIINDLQISYKKCLTKKQRAYARLKEID